MNEQTQLKMVEQMMEDLQKMKNTGKMSIVSHESYTRAIESLKDLIKNIK